MPLNPGTRLGAYEIVSLLGAGGMGEVYRARDARLRRDVALKVLPDFATGDPDRHERFTREALAVAALNHPHIVTIHSVEDVGTSVVLVMELVEGRSLAETLPPAGLPLERVLAIGIAVAEAISAAHQKGITHRDLKPANIMIGEGEQAGRIKVLDFGLAKIVAEPVPGVSAMPTAAPAHAHPMTAEGRILGTVAYMSPEQAEGKATDGRTDLFSLGVVLYEIATGRRPFTGDTNLSILSSTLRDTPRPITDLNPALPRDLERIIRRALAKDPERRHQTAKDLRNDLQDLKASLDSGEVTLPSASEVAASPSVRSTRSAQPVPSSDAQVAVALARRHSGKVVAAATALLLGVAVALYFLGRPDAQPTSSEAAGAPTAAELRVTQLTTSGTAERPAISPDGKYVAYVQNDENGYSLWLRQTTSTSNAPIVAPEPGVTLFGATFTPDATSVDFVRQAPGGSMDIWRVPFLGGPPKLLVRNVSSSIGWAPDGQRMAFLRTRDPVSLESQLIVAGADGGQERELFRLGLPTPILSLMAPWRPNVRPAWSPDGRLIALITVEPKSTKCEALFVDSQSGSVEHRVTVTGLASSLSWMNERSLLVSQARQVGPLEQLFRMSYPAGAFSRLTNDPNSYLGVSLTGDRQSLVTARRDSRFDIWVGDSSGATGSTVVQRVPLGVVERLAWSGDRLLYATSTGGKATIARLTPGMNTPEEVLTDAVTPATTADGRILFVSAPSNAAWTLWTADANGRRVSQLATEVSAGNVAATPDDRFAIYTSLAGGTLSIWTVPIDGGEPIKLADGFTFDVSPDGGSLAFTAPAGAERASLVVCALPGCTSPRPVGAATQLTPIRWTRDGRGIAYAVEGNLWVQAPDGSAPRQLTRFTDTRPIPDFAWSRDGRRLAIARSIVTNDIVLFTGVN